MSEISKDGDNFVHLKLPVTQVEKIIKWLQAYKEFDWERESKDINYLIKKLNKALK